jgi:hypothetical protein
MHGETVPFGRINVFVIYTASTSSVVHHNPDDLNLEDVNNYKEIPLGGVTDLSINTLAVANEDDLDEDANSVLD